MNGGRTAGLFAKTKNLSLLKGIPGPLFKTTDFISEENSGRQLQNKPSKEVLDTLIPLIHQKPSWSMGYIFDSMGDALGLKRPHD